jgi:predicted RNA-binding protein YlxR (DUF448 family)
VTRGGRLKDRDSPERRCLVSGDTGPKAGLIRFVVGPGDVIVPDVLGRLPGRGMYVSADRAALVLAIRKKAFARGARRSVQVPDDLVEQAERALARRVVELISMARKAGLAVAGFEKTKSWLVSGEAAVLLQAADGSDRGKAKLRPPEGTGQRIDVLSSTELGLAFGRENVIHGALAGGGLTTRVVEEASRLAGLRPDGGSKGTAGEGTTTT